MQHGHDVATPNGLGMSLADVTIPPGSTCVYFVSVVGTSQGTSTLHTGPVLSANANVGAEATADLNVVSSPLLAAPRLQESITPSSIKVGGTAQILVTLVNDDPSTAVTGVHLLGVYGPGMINAPGAMVSNTCGGLLLLHPHDGVFASDFVLIDGTIPADGNCSVAINVVGRSVAASHPSFVEQ